MISAKVFEREFEESVRSAQPGVTLYYGGVIPLRVHHNGIEYPNPDTNEAPQFGKPWLDGTYRDPKTDKVSVGNGELAIKDHYTHNRSKAKMLARTMPGMKPPQNVLVNTAIKIGAWILKHYKDQGVGYLTGDPERDKAVKIECQRRARAYRKIQTEMIVSDYWKAKAKFEADPKNQGRILSMSRTQVEAENYLASIERIKSDGVERIQCGMSNCGYWAERQEEMDLHRQIRHPGEEVRAQSVDDGGGKTMPVAKVAKPRKAKATRQYKRKPKAQVGIPVEAP